MNILTDSMLHVACFRLGEMADCKTNKIRLMLFSEIDKEDKKVFRFIENHLLQENNMYMYIVDPVQCVQMMRKFIEIHLMYKHEALLTEIDRLHYIYYVRQHSNLSSVFDQE